MKYTSPLSVHPIYYVTNFFIRRFMLFIHLHTDHHFSTFCAHYSHIIKTSPMYPLLSCYVRFFIIVFPLISPIIIIFSSTFSFITVTMYMISNHITLVITYMIVSL